MTTTHNQNPINSNKSKTVNKKSEQSFVMLLTCGIQQFADKTMNLLTNKKELIKLTNETNKMYEKVNAIKNSAPQEIEHKFFQIS